MSVAMLACRRATTTADAAALPGVTLVDDLCARPEDLAGSHGADRLVLVLHRGEFLPSHVQRGAREAGIDPLSVQVVLWEEAGGDIDRLRVMLAGSARRAAALVDATPEQLKPVLPAQIDRRSFLSWPRPLYEAVPRIEPAECASADGCRACVDECPVAAYRWVRGRVHFDKETCVSCGRCVTTCPAGAITTPAINGVAVEESIRSMVEASRRPIGIVFTCRRRTRGPSQGAWFAVDVPCAGMVPGTWPIAALMLGAGAATVASCTERGCPLDHDEVTARNLAFGAGLLEAAGLDPRLVSFGYRDVAPSAMVTAIDDPFGVHGPAATVAALSSMSGREIRFEHPGAPMGIVAVDQATCTMCTMCSTLCPSDALRHSPEGDELLLTFDAARCTACNQCVAICPEAERGAITVRRAADAERLRTGRVTVNRAGTARCEICGEPVAPTPMLERIATLLGEEHRATMDYVNRRCVNCRGS